MQVIRNGKIVVIPKKDVVFGDIVIINTGDEIPADGELLESISLSVDESSMTGEPLTHKSADISKLEQEATYPSNHVLRGTKVMEGHGIMKVFAVGDKTENGKVYKCAQIDDSVETPLNEQLDKLGKLISVASYVFGLGIIIGRTILYFTQTADFDWIKFFAYSLQSIMLAVTLIVVAVPEGLPMAVTLSLAHSMQRMLKTNNLVRKLHACETMGATTVICTDKTGTLTQNQMQVYDLKKFGEIDNEILYESISINTTAYLTRDEKGKFKVIGNPTEGALLLWLATQNIDYNTFRKKSKVIAELPFSTERKLMATLIKKNNGGGVLYVKGAPEIIINMSDNISPSEKEEILKDLSDYQNQGMRTLALAYREYNDEGRPEKIDEITLRNLKLIGIVAISDPVRKDVHDAVREVQNAGIEVKIVTGDTIGTAKEIGREIGLWDDSKDTEKNIITGDNFSHLSDADIQERAREIKIIARARPMDKKRLVEALQARNHVVAVTGDGTNDAPALKTAHVGLSMGAGTSVAKDASDITIIDTSCASISRAVMWGRSLYNNIRRFILFQMTVNVVACFTVLVGVFMDMQTPLTVTQMLWVNLIMDTFAAMALASLPPSKNVMKEKPRERNAFIINRSMLNFILGVGSLFFFILIILLYYFEHTDLTSLTQIGTLPFGVNKGLSGYELSLFFTIFVFLQFWNMFNARAFNSGKSALNLKNCTGFLLISITIFIGQILIISIGGSFFNVEPLKLSDWLIIILSTSSVLWIGELIRYIKN